MKTSGMYPRVSLAFARKIDTDLIAFTRNVVTLMTGNSQYPTPSPTLKVLTTAVDALETAVHEALDGGKIAIATRNAARAEMLSLLRQEAAYVTGNCNADLLLLLGSGFEPIKAPSPVGVLPAPENLRVSLTGVSGEMYLRFDRVTNAANYSIQTAQSSDGPWQDQTLSTSTRVTLRGLTPGKVYWVRAQANGSAGPSGWSGVASAMAV
jgi:Fibronectin type III domain